MLRWLAIGAGVTATHLLLLWSISVGELSGPAVQPRTADVVPISLLDPAGPAQAPPPAIASNKPPAPPRPPVAVGTMPAALPVTGHEAAAHDNRQDSDVSSEAGDAAPQEPAPQAPAPAQADQPPADAPARPAQVPMPMRLLYELAGQRKGLHYSADAALDWRQDGRDYLATMEVSAFLIGSRSQTSSGRIEAEGLQPERFVDHARRERSTRFDHEAGQWLNETDGSTMTMPDGTQDRLSVFIQLAIQMSGLPQQPSPGDSWTLPVAASRAIERWTFDWRGIEELALPSGRLLAWHLARQPLQPDETRLEIWLAPELAFMPARLRLQQANGDSIDQRLLRR